MAHKSPTAHHIRPSSGTHPRNSTARPCFHVDGAQREAAQHARGLFLVAYGLGAEQVPLLELRTREWGEPFA